MTHIDDSAPTKRMRGSALCTALSWTKCMSVHEPQIMRSAALRRPRRLLSAIFLHRAAYAERLPSVYTNSAANAT